jgi:hypothetical protein
MADVIINRCKLRVVRRGGWNWGPDPQRLLQEVVRAFPDLLARKLAHLLSGDVEREIAEPLKIRIPIKMSDLISVAAELHSGAPLIPGSPSAALSTRVEEALNAIILEHICPEADDQSGSDQPRGLTHDEEVVPPEARRADNLIRLLLSWSERGVLGMRLAGFSSLSMDALHHSLFEGHYLHALPDIATPAEIKRTVETLAGDFQTPTIDRKTLLRRRVEIAVELFRQFNVMPSADAVRRALYEALPVDHDSFDESRITEKPSAATFEPQTQPTRQVTTQPDTHVLFTKRSAEVYVPSALPFLLLGPLYRIGYLDALAATLGATALSSELPLFATALAYKVLDPPDRGWRRGSNTIASATAFAGLQEPVPEIALAEFSRKASPHLSALDSVVSESLIEGHDGTRPLVLYRTGETRSSSLLLVDVEGFFPITISADLKGLYATLMEFGSPLILVPASTAETELLRGLDEEGFRFITDAPPARGEDWGPLGLPLSRRCWTNDRAGANAALIRAARELENVEEEVQALWRELSVRRVSIPLATDAALETSITLAASAALGTVAWTLWRERGPVTPVLALERFRDLDARARFGDRFIEVRLPLGRRYQDLLENRLLDDIPAVTWLDERAIRFAGG